MYNLIYAPGVGINNRNNYINCNYSRALVLVAGVVFVQEAEKKSTSTIC